MINTKRLMFFFFLVLISPAVAQNIHSVSVTNEWKGIVPLRSTKLDVEKLLGNPIKQDSDSFTYSTDKESLRVSYSKGRCKGSMNGWNVPADTVLELTVAPTKEMRIDRDELEREKLLYLSSRSVVLQEKGIAYSLDYGTNSKNTGFAFNVVNYVSFMPKEADNDKRCSGFPAYNPIGTLYSPENTISKDNVLVGLDQLVAQSVLSPVEFVHYAIVYAGNSMSEKEYDELFESYEIRLYKKRKASPEKIRLLKGGRRKAFSFEIFSLRTDYPSPVPSPDFPSKEFLDIEHR